MAHPTLYGIVPPIITPMNADESINIPELRNQIERQIAGGVHGIFCFGTNGEGYILSMKEKEEILEATIDQVAGRVPVYAGTGCISTADTVYMSRRAEEMGADVLSIITPSFALASQEELYRHYVEVAKHVNIPIVLYNIPPRTGNKLLPETVARLARDVDVICGRYLVDGKSIMGLFSIDLSEPIQVQVQGSQAQADIFMGAIQKFLVK
jgi:4-hydroxy-tetrahydrodipicolinate synthase